MTDDIAEQEISLVGGNVTGAVRIGETVRRAMGPWSPAVHSLLSHLEAIDFHGAPKFLGIDEQDREVLSFMAGEVGHYPLAQYMWSDETLIAVAQFIHSYHEAVKDFVPPPDASWQMIYPDSSQHELICHNDIASYNMIYRDKKPYALIDFDNAGPGPRTWDLAHAAYRFVPLLHVEDSELQQLGLTEPQEQRHRLHLFCASYGISVQSVLMQVAPRLQALCNTIIERAQAGDSAFQKMLAEGHLEHYRRELLALQEYLPLLENAMNS